MTELTKFSLINPALVHDRPYRDRFAGAQIYGELLSLLIRVSPSALNTPAPRCIALYPGNVRTLCVSRRTRYAMAFVSLASIRVMLRKLWNPS